MQEEKQQKHFWFFKINVKLLNMNLKQSILLLHPPANCVMCSNSGDEMMGSVCKSKSDPGFGALEGGAQQVMRQVCCDDSRRGGWSLQHGSEIVLLQPWSAGPVWHGPGQVWVPPAEDEGHNFLHPCRPFERNRTTMLHSLQQSDISYVWISRLDKKTVLIFFSSNL